jgi:hypothetical protein
VSREDAKRTHGGSGGRSKRCEVKCRLDRTTEPPRTEPHGPTEKRENEQEREQTPSTKKASGQREQTTTSTTLVVTRLREAGPPTSPPNVQRRRGEGPWVSSAVKCFLTASYSFYHSTGRLYFDLYHFSSYYHHDMAQR